MRRFFFIGFLLVACSSPSPPKGFGRDVDAGEAAAPDAGPGEFTGVCGDGFWDATESCDTAIEEGLTGACPASCDDGLACTADRIAGEACGQGCVADPVEACESGDGCCPAGCDAASDDDCSDTCGNGMLEAEKERCDTAIESGEGACPSSCDDGDACTMDALVGGGCGAMCTTSPVDVCEGGDGCCPSRCSAEIDSDCEAMAGELCGNGALDAGESCDTAIAEGPESCPSQCDDGNPCTRETLTGEGCETFCRAEAIEGCGDSDWTETRVSVTTLGMSVTTGPDGVPHVVYCDGGVVGHIALSGSGPWTTESVYEGPGSWSLCEIAVGADGREHITSYGGPIGPLRYFTGEDGTWTSQDIAEGTEDGAGYGSSIALIEGAPRVAYYDYEARRLVYSAPGEGRWTMTPLDPGAAGSGPEMASQDGRAQIVYQAEPSESAARDGMLRHARWDGARWVYADVGAARRDIHAMEMHEGAAHVVLVRGGELLMAVAGDAGFRTEPLGLSLEDPDSVDLAVEPDGTMHVVLSSVGGNLWYGVRRDGTWTIDPVEIPHRVGRVGISVTGGRATLVVDAQPLEGGRDYLLVLRRR